jgi:hypothetical protein
VARRAVFEGAALEARLRELTVDGAPALEAPKVVAAFLRAIARLDLRDFELIAQHGGLAFTQRRLKLPEAIAEAEPHTASTE